MAAKVGSVHGSLTETAIAGAIPIIGNSVAVGAIYLHERRQQRKQRKEQLKQNKPDTKK
jgi:hypothetical protein